MSVDLPAPFSPQIACTSPARTSRLTSCSARTPGKDLEIERISKMLPVIPSPPPWWAGAVPPRRRHRTRRRSLPLLDLLLGVVPAVDEQLGDVARVDDVRLEQVGRHDLDAVVVGLGVVRLRLLAGEEGLDRKSTRLNSSHVKISYAVF